MITVKYYDMDGKEVRPEDWTDALVTGAIGNVIEQYQQRALDRINTLVCPIHGDTVNLNFNVNGMPLKPSIEIQATTCCDEFAKRAIEVAQQCWSTET